MKYYKVGDIVYIKSLNWYNANKDGSGNVRLTSNVFIEPMSFYCGMRAKILSVSGGYGNSYEINLDSRSWGWTEEMFEDIKEIRKRKLEKLNVDTI